MLDIKITCCVIIYYFDVLLALEKLPPYGQLFSSSCRGLQPSAATVRPLGPNFVFSGEKKYLYGKKIIYGKQIISGRKKFQTEKKFLQK